MYDDDTVLRGLMVAVMVLVSVGLGCSNDFTSVEAPEGSRIVVAFGDTSGHVVAVESGRRALRRLELSSDMVAAVFVVHPSDFIDTEGAPVDPERFEAAEILPAQAPARDDACAGCLAPAVGSDPAFVHDGDRCAIHTEPVRSFRGHELTEPLEEEVIQRLRSGTEIRWGGACPALVQPVARSSLDFTVCPILPEGSPHSFLGTAMSSEGAILRVGESYLATATPDRPLVITPMTLPGPLRAVAPAPDGDGFVIVTTDYGAMVGSGSRWQRARLSDAGVELRTIEPPIDILATSMFTLGGRTFVGGEIRTRLGDFMPAIGLCEGLDCRRLAFRDTEDCHFGSTSHVKIAGFASTSSAVLAVGGRGGLVASSGDEFECLLDEQSAERPEGGLRWPDGRSALWFDVVGMETLGSEALVCGTMSIDREFAGALVSIRLPELQSRLVATSSESCQSVVRLPGTDRLVATFGARSFEYDGALSELSLGVESADLRALYPTIGRQMNKLRVAGSWVAVSGDAERSLYRIDASTRIETVSQPTYPAVRALAAERQDGVIEVLRPGAPRARVTIGPKCRECEIVAGPLTPELPLGAAAVGAVMGSSGDALVFGSSNGSAWVMKLSADGATAARSFDGFAPIRDAAEIRAGRFVLAHGAALTELDTRGELTLTPIEVNADDPRTTEVERLPLEATAPFTFVRANGGVAWVGGRASLVRVVPSSGGGLAATGFWYGAHLGPYLGGHAESGVVSSILLQTPSRVSLTIDLPKTAFEGLARARVFQLVSVGAPCLGEVVGEDLLMRTCKVEEASSDFELAANGAGLAIGSGGLLMVGVNGLVLSFDEGRYVRVGHEVRRVFDTPGDTFAAWSGAGVLSVVLGR
ncbi:MAG: hypothetical protein HY791_08170 [Deltaproteobacteria bacterium]|nr:hypothetical protein [Deltaproteobacteria bacterium]